MFQSFQLNFTAIKILLSNPKLWKYAIIPILISGLLFVGLLVGLFFLVDRIIEVDSKIIEPVGIWQHCQYYFYYVLDKLSGGLKWVLVFVLGLLFTWYLFGIIASIVLIPFLEMLSAQVEIILRGGSDLDNPWYRGLVSSFLFSLFFTILKIMFAIGCTIIGLIFPPIGILSFVVIAWFCSMEALDLSLSRRLYTAPQKLKFLFGNSKDMISMGSFSSILLLVPIVQILQPVIAACAGTILWVQKTPELGVAEKYKYLIKEKS